MGETTFTDAAGGSTQLSIEMHQMITPLGQGLTCKIAWLD